MEDRFGAARGSRIVQYGETAARGIRFGMESWKRRASSFSSPTPTSPLLLKRRTSSWPRWNLRTPTRSWARDRIAKRADRRPPVRPTANGEEDSSICWSAFSPGSKSTTPSAASNYFAPQTTRRAFELQRVERFGFDPEVLFLVERLGGKVVEIPVRWNHNPATKVHYLRDSLHMTLDLIPPPMACCCRPLRKIHRQQAVDNRHSRTHPIFAPASKHPMNPPREF